MLKQELAVAEFGIWIAKQAMTRWFVAKTGTDKNQQKDAPMKKFLTGLMAAMFLLSIGTSQAAETAKEKKEKKPRATPEEMFNKKDADGDGALSLAEWTGKSKGKAAEKVASLIWPSSPPNQRSHPRLASQRRKRKRTLTRTSNPLI